MSKVESDDPNKVVQELIAANGQNTDIQRVKDFAGNILWYLDKAGNMGCNFKAVMGIKNMSQYSSLQAAIDDTSGGCVFVPYGVNTLTTRAKLPHWQNNMLVGVGSPDQECDMWNNGGSIIEGNDPNGILYMDTVTYPQTTGALIRDIAFRQNVQQTGASTVCVSMDGAFIGGIEACSVFNVKDRSGVDWPMYGSGLSLMPGSAGDRFWARDLCVAGFGNSSGVPKPQMYVNSNHFMLYNIHISCMGKSVAAPALRIQDMGMRASIDGIQFFMCNSATPETNACIVMDVYAAPSNGNIRVMRITDITLEACKPASWQGKYMFMSAGDDYIRWDMQRCVNASGFTTWNPFRANHAMNLVIHGKMGGTPTSGLQVPYGFVTNFVDGTNYMISPAPVASAGSTLTSAQSYTCEVRPVLLYISGGTISEILANGVTVDVSTPVIMLTPGETFKITYSVAPTIKAYFVE